MCEASLSQRCFGTADFEHSAFANDHWQDKGIHHVDSTQGVWQKVGEKHLRQQTEFYPCEESHSSNITSGTPEMETWRLYRELEYCWNPTATRFLHLITNHWNVLITLCITILNQPVSKAAARFIRKTNGLSRPSNSCSGWLWSSWWICPTFISSKSVINFFLMWV